MIVAMVDRDYLWQKWNKEGGEHGNTDRRGTVWTAGVDLNVVDAIKSPKVRFRCLDDDGVVYYGGWLYDDDMSEVQFAVLDWAKYDAGCTTIEVKDSSTNEWRQDIG